MAETPQNLSDDEVLIGATPLKKKTPSIEPNETGSEPIRGDRAAYRIGEPDLAGMVVEDKIRLNDDEDGFVNQLYGSLESTLFMDNPRLAGKAIEGMGRVSGIDSMREFGEKVVADYDASPEKEKFVPKVSTYKDVDGLNSALEYVGSTLGQGLGSIGVTIAGGAAGTLGGAAVGSVVPGAGTAAGATVGGVAGSMGSGFILNYGDTYDYLVEQEGMDPDDAAQYALVPGAIMGGLEAYGVGKLLGPAKGKLSSDIIKRTGQLAVRGAGTEAVTEAAQQIVQESAGELAEATGYATEDIDFQQRFDNVVNALIAGGLTGGVVGGASAPFKAPPFPEPPPPKEEPPAPDTPEPSAAQPFDTIEDFEQRRRQEIEDDPESEMMERRQDYYEGIADLRGDPLDVERPTTPEPDPADMLLELDELARFKGVSTLGAAQMIQAEQASGFDTIEDFESQRQAERYQEALQGEKEKESNTEADRQYDEEIELNSEIQGEVLRNLDNLSPHEMTKEEFESTATKLMHGTSREFDRFDASTAKDRYNRLIGDQRKRWYFTDQDEVAGRMANHGGHVSVQVEEFAKAEGIDLFEDFDEYQQGIDEVLPQLKDALRERLQTGNWSLYRVTSIGTGRFTKLVRVNDPDDIPDLDYEDYDTIRLYKGNRYPKVIEANVYGKTLDLTDPNNIPEDLKEVLIKEGNKFRPWIDSLPNFNHEYSSDLIKYAREKGYGKIKVRDVSESGFESVIGLEEFIEFGVNPHKAFIKRAMEEGKTVSPEVLKDYPDLYALAYGKAPRPGQTHGQMEFSAKDVDVSGPRTVILLQSPADVVGDLTAENQRESIEKLRSLILDLPEDSKQALEEFENRLGSSDIKTGEPAYSAPSPMIRDYVSTVEEHNKKAIIRGKEQVLSGQASPEQYRLLKYLLDNPRQLDKYAESNPDHNFFNIDLGYATNGLLELVIFAQETAKMYGITEVTIDDILSGRFAETVKEVSQDKDRFDLSQRTLGRRRALNLKWQSEKTRRRFRKDQKRLDQLGIDYKIRIEPPTRVMLVAKLIHDFRWRLRVAADDGKPMPPIPNLDLLIQDKPSLPRKGSRYETFGAGSEKDFSRASLETDLSMTLENLFEGVYEMPKRPAMGVSRPGDVAEFVESPAGAEPKWYEKLAERQRGAANILSQMGETQQKLAKAWQADSGIATIREFEYDIVKEFVNMVGPSRLQNIAFAIEPEIRFGMMTNEPLGLYFFGKDILGISHSAIAGGRFVDTTIHELWHGLSQYLPDDTVNDLYKQYARERGKFMRDNPEAFDRSGELVDVTMAKNQSTYRFSSFDEWCVEKMKDLSIEDASGRLLERDKTLGYSDTAPGKAWERALRALADLVRGHYNQLKAIFGRDVARQTYTDFMSGKYMEQVRNTPLADVIKITPQDEARAAQRWTSYLDALDADEGVEAAAQSMSEETERFIEQMVVGPAEVVTEEEFKSLASQPPTPATDAATAGAKTPADVEEAKRLWKEKGVESPYFKRWFGDSKVIDEAGKPLVVHHGTDAEPFEVFDRAKSGKGPSKVGFWFSDDPEFSSIYGKNVSVYLNIENPKKLTQDEWNDIREEHARDDEWFSSWRDGLIEQGYDGIIVESTTEKLGRFTVSNPGFYAAFEPTQIKSVENVGTFDPTDPSILRGIGLGAAALPAAGALMADDEDEVKDDQEA